MASISFCTLNENLEILTNDGQVINAGKKKLHLCWCHLEISYSNGGRFCKCTGGEETKGLYGRKRVCVY